MTISSLHRVLRARVILFATLGLFACGDSSGPRPVPARADRGSTQTLSALVAQPVTPVPAVTVLDARGRPVSGVAVAFSASDGGAVGMPSVRTDAQGIASVGSWTLGTRAGRQTLTATIAGLAPVIFEATAHAAAPAALVADTAELRAVAGTVIVVPDLKVIDSYGNGVSGIAVRFAITSALGGNVAEQVLSDSLGIARASWTLGTAAGSHTLRVTAAGLEAAPVQFRAIGTAGPAVRLILREQPATAQSGIVFAVQPALQVTDQHGNAVAIGGVAVGAELIGSAATLAAAPVITNATGRASFAGAALTGRAGSYTLRFSAVGLTEATTIVQLVGGAASGLALVTAPSRNVAPGAAFPVQPVIELRDAQQNVATVGPTSVTVSLESGAGVLNGNLSAAVVDARASFSNLAFTGSGTFRLRFTAGALPALISADLLASSTANCGDGNTIVLDYTLGQTARFTTDSIHSPRCLEFDQTRNSGQQYLVMFENMPSEGEFGSALFPGFNNSGAFISSIATAPAGSIISTAAVRPSPAPEELPPGMLRSWDFGAGPIYELQPATPPHLVPQPRIKRASGEIIAANAASPAPAVGDTLLVYLEAIGRLGIPAGTQKAVVRQVTDDLVFAEDVRLGTVLTRQSGGLNRPLTTAEMDSIATLYAAEPRRQSDRLFDQMHNAATQAQQSRIIAVHTLMPGDNIWGYTYASTNVFAFDFWVTTDGSTKGVNQSAVRAAHNLFMHEIAHMRHWGLLERAGRTALRGNLWLVEGFARFSERLVIASYLLGQDEPSRTANYVLGTYPNISPASREDVPVYLNMGAQVIAGYGNSSYIFDYLADQVAAASGDWRAALREFLINGGAEPDLDVTVAALLPGMRARSLFTHARVALYTDDIGTPGLPQWTQFLQYDLRASRPAGSLAGADPRNAWPRIVPGSVFIDRRNIAIGGAYGYVIDGTAAASNASITLDPTAGPHGIVSVTRIR